MNANALDSLIHHQLPAAAGGDRVAFGRIVEASQSMVASIALAIVRDVAASEDVAQEAFLDAWQNLRRLQNPASFLPWLRQITRNRARDHLRARQLRANPVGDIDALIAALADPAPGPADLVAGAEELAAAAAVIDALPADTHEVVLLYYREGQSTRQVAALLGLQEAAVRKRLSRARERIREEVLARFGEFARQTAPGAGFAAAIGLSIATAAPPAAAAGTFSLGTTAAGSGATFGLAALGGAGIGLAGGLGGIWWGMRRYLQAPFDAREKREILQLAFAMSALVVLFVITVLWLTTVPGWVPHVSVSLLYMLGLGWACSRWMPRVFARRQAWERARDPEGSARREAVGRRWSFWGRAIGFGLGGGGVILGLWLSERIG